MEKVFVRALLVLMVLVSECKENTDTVNKCPAVNKYILEGSSDRIVPNISSYYNSILLCRTNLSSSHCDPILNVRNGRVRFYYTVYKKHFSALGDDLMIDNFNTSLTGEYQLLRQLTEKCLQRIFLYMLGTVPSHAMNKSIPEDSSNTTMLNISSSPNLNLSSKPRHHYGTIGGVLSIAVLAVVLLCKQRRGNFAQPSKEVPDSGNEPSAMETKETTIDKNGKEAATEVNGMS